MIKTDFNNNNISLPNTKQEGREYGRDCEDRENCLNSCDDGAGRARVLIATIEGPSADVEVEV